jgi:hypothetical protein
MKNGKIKLASWEKKLLPVSLITPQKFARQVKKRNEMF